MADRATPTQRAIWAAIENLKPFTLDDLRLVAEVEPDRALSYLQTLLSGGYLALAGVRKADSGEAIPSFKLLVRHGPEAPFLDDAGHLADPNLPGAAVKREPRPGSAFPRFRARFRVAAEQFGRPFMREELFEAMGLPRSEWKQFQNTIHRLTFDRELKRNEDGRFEYLPDRNSPGERVRLFMHLRIGKELTLGQVSDDLGFRVQAQAIRYARDLLAAEGIRVNRGRRGSDQQRIYRIERDDNGA